jgi:replication factor A1
MNVDEIFSKLKGKIDRAEFDRKIQEKVDEFGGLLSDEGAALIVATDMGVDLQIERPHEFLHIKDLIIGMSDIWLCARATCISTIKEFQRQSGIGRVANIDVMDATGSTRVVLWDDLADISKTLNKGDIVEVQGGYVKKGYREGVEIHLSPSRRGRIVKKAETSKDLPECKTSCTSICDLEEEMADVDVVGRVKQLFRIREFQRNGGVGKVASLAIVDDTGEITLCLWNDKADIATRMNRGDIIAVEDGYTKMGLNGLELHSGWRGRIILNPEVTIKELPPVERVTLIDIEPGQSCDVSGVISDVGEKRSFVKSDGSPGYLASFTLQDDTADIRVVLWNEKADEIDRIVPGMPVGIDNAFAKEGMAGLELHVSSLGHISIEEQFTPVQKICTLQEGPVDIMGRYYQGELIDESGRIPLTLSESVEDGQLIRVKGTHGDGISVETVEPVSDEFPSLESLLHPARKAIAAVEPGDYVGVYGLVKKVIPCDGYERISLDDGTGELMGVVVGDIDEGEEYCFYARIYEGTSGKEFISYQYTIIEPEKEAFNMIKELEGLVEV